MPKLLFASWHRLIDPSSGAAVATRDLLELMAARGWECRAFCGPQLDFESGESISRLFAEQQIPCELRAAPPQMPPFVLHHFRQGDLRGTVYVPESATSAPLAADGLPMEHETAFLALLDRFLERERPDVLLTYGGRRISRRLMAAARARGVPVVFALHNFAYRDAGLFRDATAVLVPSQFTRDYYRRTLGLECTAIPSPINWSRVRCEPDPGRQYVTFVNPQPAKGLLVFARIAVELDRLRPDIPLLIVEGRGRARQWLLRTGAGLGRLRNLHRMANTADPRRFYRLSRMVLMPSLCDESFGRVAAEALINGIPVLASRRGALPEVLGAAGFLLEVPGRYTPTATLVPTAAEVAPWTEANVRLWDDADSWDEQSRRCRSAAEAWRPERLTEEYDSFFAGIASTSSTSTT